MYILRFTKILTQFLWAPIVVKQIVFSQIVLLPPSEQEYHRIVGVLP